jgi:hypothetical protein
VVHEKKIFKWPYPIFAILWLSPFEEDLDLHLNKLEFPSCKKCLHQVWLKLTKCFILKDSFQYTNVKIVSPLVSPILTLRDHNLYKLKSALCHLLLLSPLGEGQSPSFDQFRTPSPKDDLCQIWLKLAQWFWRRSRKYKSLQTNGRTDRQTDRQRAIRIAHLSFQVR